ncbi:MAG: class I SAM-dependent methyltransferase [Synergistaceae bacterium]|jgi:SAM-dependent methyltransferase|nr:class I SAM-dependent methyltransferase [Synergistaceae bacterium]
MTIMGADKNWNERIRFLDRSRKTLWNEDYAQFLVERVWKITEPVRVIDFGCGTGFLGALFMPLLPRGSSYTGVDRAAGALEEAKNALAGAEFEFRFIEADLENFEPESSCDLAICQALLMHMPDPGKILMKMRDSLDEKGLMVCIEVDWHLTNAALFIDGFGFENLYNFDALEKIWRNEVLHGEPDRRIGLKLPVLMRRIGLKDVNVRMNDCVRFVDPLNPETHQRQVEGFFSGARTQIPKNRDFYIAALKKKGLTDEEARQQYESKVKMAEYLTQNRETASIVHSPSFIISWGRK